MKTKPVKIVATIGPASHSKETILALAQAGVNVFRINLSHAYPQEIAERCKWIREAEEELNKPLSIMGDLPGPKIRITEIQANTQLKKGQEFIISKNISIGDSACCGLNHSSIIDTLKVGAEIFIDDGTIKLVVKDKLKDSLVTEVLAGGHLKTRKGFSAEGITLSTTGVLEKDRIGIKLMLKNKADALAISFAQTKNDIMEIKKLLPKNNKMMLIAKIETAQGVENAEEILEVADGLMVARGDLGLAVPIAQIPHIQKRLIDICVKHARPVITATQMLESMISKPLPTRAEVTDVANAILDRTDAIMLSAETAEGKFPVEAVEMMVKIISETVKHIESYEYKEKHTTPNAISDSVGKIADQVEAKLIIAFTNSGVTARRIARHRHKQPVLAMSSDPAVIKKLNFVWGVHPYIIEETKDFADLLKQAKTLVTKNNTLQLSHDENYVISAGMPFGESGSTNMILVQKV